MTLRLTYLLLTARSPPLGASSSFDYCSLRSNCLLRAKHGPSAPPCSAIRSRQPTLSVCRHRNRLALSRLWQRMHLSYTPMLSMGKEWYIYACYNLCSTGSIVRTLSLTLEAIAGPHYRSIRYSLYSKNPHIRTNGLRTPSLKFGKKYHIYKNTFSLKFEKCS